MPYYISDENPDCSGWAVEKDDGEVMGCHDTKQAAVNQMVAISVAEDMEPGGERALPDNYRPATAEDVPEGRACGNCVFFNEENVDEEGRAFCEKWDEYVMGGWYCNAWQGRENRDEPAPPEDQIEGSDENEPGSASGAGGDIELSDATQTALRNKVEEHNEKMSEGDEPRWKRTTYGQLAAVYRRGAGAYSTSHRPGVSRGAWAMARVNAYLYLLRNGRPENANYVTDNDLLPSGHPKSTRSLDERRQVDMTIPDYIQAAAARGLEMYEQGLGGDGLVERTIREARAMARGEVTEDKAIRANAWGARHEPDLRADGARPDEDGFPTPGAVAHYLWGIPTGARYDDARAFWERKAAQIREDEGRTMIEVTPVEPRSKKSGIEFRSVVGEIRSEDGGNRFVGYAAVFNSDSEPLPFTERILPGAFNKSLRNRRRDVRAYVNHDSSMVLASTRSKTLDIREDERGLRVEFELPEGVSYANDLRALMQASIVDKMSFGFTVPRGGDSWNDDGTVRELREIALHEVSVVTGHPAYTGTAAAVRSLDALAKRSGLAVEEVSEALDALADGHEIDAAKADALITAIQGSVKQVEPDLSGLALKAKQTDLLAKKVF